MSTAPLPLVETGRDHGADAPETRLPHIGAIGGAATGDDPTARWTLDVSAARPVIAAIAGGNRPANWVELVLAGVRIADADQNLVHLVGAYAGRRRMIGQPVTAYWPPESWAMIAELIVAAVGDYPPAAPRSRKITSLAFVDPVISISTDDTGARPDIVYVSIGGTVVDHRSLWSVRASEARYRNLIHHLPTALIQVDSTPISTMFDKLRLDGITDIVAYLDTNPDVARVSANIVQITDANRNAVELLAADGAYRLIGSVGFLFEASPETAKRVIAAHFNGQRSHAEIMKLRTFDGRLRDVQLSVTYPMPPERLDVTLLSLEDITDRLRTEAQLRQLTADYSRAARISMLGELATSIAHEVNQPLSAIVTNAETSLRWLSRDDPNLAKVGQLTVRIAENARRASDIVQRIRGMAARREPERVVLDLNEIIDEALLFVWHEVESRSITLSTDLVSGLPAVLGDRIQLQQVIVNLLVNAVQAQHGAPGRIDLGTAMGADGAVVFAIHDSGSGIAVENLDRIFGSFFTTKDEGIGIGLALCQSIIAAHGGTITALNHPEGGALFQFSLPPAGET